MRSTWLPEELEALRSGHAEGLSRRELARRLGRPKATVDYQLAKLGVREAPRADDLAARFWAAVDRRGPDECWPWLGYRDVDGYGSISRWPTRDGAHRVSYELNIGPIPEEMAVRHRCDNPPCCNPAHLELGTAVDNNRDKTLRGRNAQGERHGMARYDACTVRRVKQLLANGRPQIDVARLTGVKLATVHKIATGKQWKEVSVNG